MNIEQMLRDAIKRKTAKILKEEYGIEMSKEVADKSSKDDQDYGNYQKGKPQSHGTKDEQKEQKNEKVRNCIR